MEVRGPAPFSHKREMLSSKRKHHNQVMDSSHDSLSNKRQRLSSHADFPQSQQQQQQQQQPSEEPIFRSAITLASLSAKYAPQQTPGLMHRPHEDLITRLADHYDIKTLSVQNSTSIAKHVDKALTHLERFSWQDKSVLPGVVLFYGRSEAANKVVTISEMVRRRVGEAEQKWYAYTVLSAFKIDLEATSQLSVAEDGVLSGAGGGGQQADCNATMSDVDDDEGEAFETMATKVQKLVQQTVHEKATQPAKVKHKDYVSIIISRVPLEELRILAGSVVQTNEAHIEWSSKVKMGHV